MFFFCQKFIDGNCCVTWSVVVVQHPSAFNAWSHTYIYISEGLHTCACVCVGVYRLCKELACSPSAHEYVVIINNNNNNKVFT